MPREHRNPLDPDPENATGTDWPGADRRLPQVEVVTREAADETPAPPARPAPVLALWFLGVFLLVALPASLWNFSRPPVYRAAATVLTIVPEERIGAGGAQPDLQHVAIQRRMLLGRDLLVETLDRLKDQDSGAAGAAAATGDTTQTGAAPGRETSSAADGAASPRETGTAQAAAPNLASREPRGPLPAADERAAATLTPDDLLAMLAVEPVPQTNLVEVSGRGEHPALLAAIVNHWLDAYQSLREREIETQIGGRLDKLDERAAALEQNIQAKRDEIDAFRQRFDIVTLGRDSNQAVARLENLQQAQGKAEDESIAARARLQSLQAAIANGQAVVSDRFAQALNDLRQQAAEARVAVERLRKRYTEMFIQSDPDKRALPERLETLEARIAEVERDGRREALESARNAVDETTGRVLEIRRELAEQKLVAARFSSGFAEYEALKEDLAELEKMQRETESKRVELGTTALVGYPQVEVIEPAYPPRDPIAPPYWRDLGYILAAASAAGLIAVIVLAWLDARARGGRMPRPVTGVRVWTADAAADAGPRFPRPAGTDTGRLEQPAEQDIPSGHLPPPQRPPVVPRQLMGGEVEALWELAGLAERQLIGLLLCGLSEDEAAALGPDAIDLGACRVQVTAPRPRNVALPPRLCALLADTGPLPAWSSSQPENRVAFDDLLHRLSLLASDAGIAHADEVDAGALRDTYLIFLVRQGARLTELEQVAGPMSGPDIRRFAPYSPPGASRPIDQLDRTYPLFA